LYDGDVFNDREGALQKVQALGFDGILARALDAVARLPPDVVYVGFSNGGACAELAAATRPVARGAVLIHAPLMLKDLGWREWPMHVPVQVHFARQDPLRVQAVIDCLGQRVRQSGSAFEQFDYDAPGHLFTDPGFPAYSAQATAQVTDRVAALLNQVR
jgi:dienelactone hydrolase